MIPEGWRKEQLASLANISGGTTPSKEVPSYWGGEILWATPSDVTSLSDSELYISDTSNKISALALKETSVKLLPPHTVLMTSRATIGEVVINTVSMATNQGFCNFIPGKEITSKYLAYWLKNAKSELKSISSGSTFLEVGRSALKNLELLLPPLPEQKRIAEVLISVDAAIDATKAVIIQTKKVKQGLLQTLLTRGIGHMRFKPSPIGEIPEGWGIKTLQGSGVTVVDGDRGKKYPNGDDFQDAGYCLFLNAKNVTKDGFRFEECQFITEDKHLQLRKGILKRDDLVITTRGTIGNIAAYTPDIPFNVIRINSGMVIIRNVGNYFITEFLAIIINSPVVEKQIKMMSFGSAQQQLTVSILNDLHLPIPTKEEQKTIATIFSNINNVLNTSTTHLASPQHLKKGLMQDLLTGKVRVPELFGNS